MVASSKASSPNMASPMSRVSEVTVLDPSEHSPKSNNPAVVDVEEVEEEEQEEEEGTLTKAVLRSSLSFLGHNRCSEIAYTRSLLSHLNLRCITRLGSYVYLQHVSLDHNKLTDLSPLKNLHSLLYLSARHNRLGSDVFNEISGSAASLENLYLDHNNITSLDGLHTLPYLLNFTASYNSIKALRREHFSGMTGLTRLNLSNNDIEEIDPDTFATSPFVRTINFNKNRISHVHFAAFVTGNLETLRLSHNNISDLGVTLASCQALATLDLSENKLASMADLRGISPAKMLRYFSIEDNPLCHAHRASDQSSESALGGTNGSTNLKSSLEHTTTTTGDNTATTGDNNNGCDDELSSSEVRKREERKVIACTEIVMRDMQYHDDEDESAAADGEHSEDEEDEDAYGRDADDSDGQGELAVDYAAVSAPNTYGLVRRVLTANRAVPVPWAIDKAKELKRLPVVTRDHLQILYLFPQLVELNGTAVVAEDVARAQFFFRQSTQ